MYLILMHKLLCHKFLHFLKLNDDKIYHWYNAREINLENILVLKSNKGNFNIIIDKFI